MKQIFSLLSISKILKRQDLLRAVLLFFVGVATVVVISACGIRVQTPASLENISSPTRTFEHALGKTIIPENPDRIISLVPGAVLDSLLALEAKPIGMVIFNNRDYEVPPYLADQVTGIESVGDVAQPNLESIVQLQPDLIIISDFQKRLYPRLSKISPTVALSSKAKSWQETFLTLADLVNKTETAQQLLDQYEQRAAAFKSALAKQPDNPDVSVVRVRADGIFLYVKSSPVGQILEELGIQRSPAQDVFLKRSPRISISLEELEKADGDVMFVYGLEFRNTQAAYEQLKADPLWKQLKAVRTNRVYVVPDSYWSFPGIQGLDLLIDDLLTYLIEAPT
ncbi:MAG: iron-siderophore ABC transporter substrate-binding protein [Cyanobacteria bacterium P01_C01_bin.118]